jgi:hypothetical protein
VSPFRLLVSSVMLLAAGCGGDGVVTGPAGPPSGDGPTLSALQSTIFTPKCAVDGCHTGAAPQQGMDLSAGRTFVNTVGVDVTELPGYKRVVAGSSADSYLYMKIAADPRIVGEQMPFGGMLTAAEIDSVRAWIDAGALDN